MLLWEYSIKHKWDLTAKIYQAVNLYCISIFGVLGLASTQYCFFKLLFSLFSICSFFFFFKASFLTVYHRFNTHEQLLK